MKNRRQYLVPILLVIVFAVPGFAALLFFQHPQWLEGTKTNRGELVKQPVLIQQSSTEPKWKLVYWCPNDCGKVCQEELGKLARVRLALGRKLYDVDVQLWLGHQAQALTAKLQHMLDDRDMHVLNLGPSEQEKLSKQPVTYIVNKKGYLVLSFSKDANLKDIHHDLKRLLSAKE